MIHPSQTSSWPAAQAAKAAFKAVLADPNASAQEKKAAQRVAYTAMSKCLQQAGYPGF